MRETRDSQNHFAPYLAMNQKDMFVTISIYKKCQTNVRKVRFLINNVLLNEESES